MYLCLNRSCILGMRWAISCRFLHRRVGWWRFCGGLGRFWSFSWTKAPSVYKQTSNKTIKCFGCLHNRKNLVFCFLRCLMIQLTSLDLQFLQTYQLTQVSSQPVRKFSKTYERRQKQIKSKTKTEKYHVDTNLIQFIKHLLEIQWPIVEENFDPSKTAEASSLTKNNSYRQS